MHTVKKLVFKIIFESCNYEEKSNLFEFRRTYSLRTVNFLNFLFLFALLKNLKAKVLPKFWKRKEISPKIMRIWNQWKAMILW